MSTRALKSVTWLWIASLLTATVGVSGQQIYCYCMGKTTFSVFKTQEECDLTANRETKNCCTKTAAATPVHHCCDKKNNAGTGHGCTKKTTRVFQLKTEFTVQEKVAEKWPPAEQSFVPVSLSDYPRFVPCPKSDFRSFAHPPPLSGRILSVRYGVFRC